jgi:hypothetical protein
VQATLSLRKHVRAWTHRQGTGVNIGHGWGQMLAVDAPAFRFAIESKPASARQNPNPNLIPNPNPNPHPHPSPNPSPIPSPET